MTGEAPAAISEGMTLSEYMQANGLKLKDVCDRTGLTQGFISEISRGIKRPSLDVADLIAEATGGAVMANDWMRWEPTPRRRKRARQ